METAPSPLARKLRLKPGVRAAVIGAPPGYLEVLGPAGGVTIAENLDGPLDWIEVFVRNSAELARIVGPLTAALAPAGLAWMVGVRRAPLQARRGAPDVPLSLRREGAGDATGVDVVERPA